jgi:hypothetical protein
VSGENAGTELEFAKIKQIECNDLVLIADYEKQD